MNHAPKACLLVSLSLCYQVVARGETTLCHPGEDVYFSCAIKRTNKTASVCGSKKLSTLDDDRRQGYIQYRFGTVKHTELVYPKKKEHPSLHFTWIYTFGQVGMSKQLVFKIPPYTYNVSSGVVSELASTTGREVPTAGVEILNNAMSSEFKSFVCVNPRFGIFDFGNYIPAEY